MNNIEIIRSRRRTISIEVKSSGLIIVRAPLFCSSFRIKAFLKEKQGWIDNTLNNMQLSKVASAPLTQEETEALRKKAKEIIPKKVSQFSAIMGAKYSGIKITSATKRFGSCSGKNSLCFSLYLMQFDDELIDYVVVHELAHTVHHNHSKDFYNLVEKYIPDYKARQKKLKGRGCPINHKLLEETQ